MSFTSFANLFIVCSVLACSSFVGFSAMDLASSSEVLAFSTWLLLAAVILMLLMSPSASPSKSSGIDMFDASAFCSTMSFSLFVPVGVSETTVPERGSLSVCEGVLGIDGVLRCWIGVRATLNKQLMAPKGAQQVNF